MTIKYNVTGARRKELVSTIANWTGCEAKYLGAPTFAYEVDYFTIDKNGTLIFDDRADSEVIERLLEMLYDNGFEAEALPEAEGTELAETQTTEGSGLIVTIPIDNVSVGNLTKLLDAKGNLIRKAFGIDELPLKMNEDSISFLWFENEELDADRIKAYSEFIALLCQMTVKQQRITATEKEVGNEKYAFRCLLLRLGFVGKEYKTSRKILLENLEGSSAFKSGKKKESEVV